MTFQRPRGQFKHGSNHGPPQDHAPGYGGTAPTPPPRKKSNVGLIAGGVAGALVMIGIVNGCRNRSTTGTTTSPSATPVTSAPPKPRALPPEPAPPFASMAKEVPDKQARLEKDPIYAHIWEPEKRQDLDLMLTQVSQTAFNGQVWGSALKKKFKAMKQFVEPGARLTEIYWRLGRFPDDFASKFKTHLESVKSEPHLGVWKDGNEGHDFSALAAWFNREDPAYLRELLAARSKGPFSWATVTLPKPPDFDLQPWLTTEKAAIERLALLTELTAEERARLAWLEAEAKKPRQPNLGEAFKLGDFTYTIKDVETNAGFNTPLGQKLAGKGARFVVVRYTIRNDGRETETVLADDFRIVDEKDREFRPSSEANSALAMSGDKDLLVSELQPGLTKDMATAFEMPDDAAKGIITLVIPEKGLLGTGSVRITLK